MKKESDLLWLIDSLSARVDTLERRCSELEKQVAGYQMSSASGPKDVDDKEVMFAVKEPVGAAEEKNAEGGLSILETIEAHAEERTKKIPAHKRFFMEG